MIRKEEFYSILTFEQAGGRHGIIEWPLIALYNSDEFVHVKPLVVDSKCTDYESKESGEVCEVNECSVCRGTHIALERPRVLHQHVSTTSLTETDP
jgi:hypothetical protein